MRRRSWPAGLAVLLLAACSDGGATVARSTPSATVSASPSPSPSPTLSLTPSLTPSPTPSPTPSRTASPTPPVAARTASPTPKPSPKPVAKAWTVSTVTAKDLPHSWRSGCPVGPSQLRRVTVPYLGWDGVQHRGELVVQAKVADAIGRTFTRLFAERFPIRSMKLVDAYGGSDDESMAADNTSAFNCRPVEGSSSWSMHAYGLAVDINPRENPYIKGGEVEPPEGKAYVDRTPTRKGMISAGGPVVRAFSAIGWGWGGSWSSSKDYQHFSSSGQ